MKICAKCHHEGKCLKGSKHEKCDCFLGNDKDHCDDKHCDEKHCDDKHFDDCKFEEK